MRLFPSRLRADAFFLSKASIIPTCPKGSPSFRMRQARPVLAAAGKAGQQRPLCGGKKPLAVDGSQLVFYLFHRPIGAGLPPCWRVPSIDGDKRSSLPGIKYFRRLRPLWRLRCSAQPRLHDGLHASQAAPQPFSETRARNPYVVGIAAAIEDMKGLRSTGPALQ